MSLEVRLDEPVVRLNEPLLVSRAALAAEQMGVEPRLTGGGERPIQPVGDESLRALAPAARGQLRNRPSQRLACRGEQPRQLRLRHAELPGGFGARPRAQAAGELGVSEPELSRLLAVARKALRRTVAQLPAGGWCERAERLISDRLDGTLAPAGEARLDSHLLGCERCAIHEQRLVQAHDRLVEAYLEAHSPRPALAASAKPPAA